MSLLIDARKKLQPAQQGEHASQAPESSQRDHPPETGYLARNTSHHLFAAKPVRPLAAFPGINRRLLAVLGATALLLVAGANYLWHADSAGYPVNPPSVAPPARPLQLSPAVFSSAPQKNLAPKILATGAASAGSADSIRNAKPVPAAPPLKNTTATPQPQEASPIRIERQRTEPLDPQLRDAYLAYRGGKLNEARQLYLAMFEKDMRNPDVLLGLAAIAQQRGENQAAARYFGRVLAQDPRNAAANAGMSALSAADDHNESRLKILLREQGNSDALHFALGNLYADQSRWGEAQQSYFNAYTLQSGNAEYAFNLAVSLDHLGQSKLAMQYYQRALQLDETHRAGFDHAQLSQRVRELAR